MVEFFTSTPQINQILHSIFSWHLPSRVIHAAPAIPHAFPSQDPIICQDLTHQVQDTFDVSGILND
jgi:hypothetical protein